MPAYKNLDLKQLQTIASELARQLKSQSAVIGLTGNLGAGKTTFIKAFAKALGIKQVSSPTFVIMHEHRARGTNLYHLDLYRLEKSAQLLPLGISEVLNQSAPRLVLIEWVEKFPSLKKSCDLLITFKIQPNNLRDVQIQTN